MAEPLVIKGADELQAKLAAFRNRAPQATRRMVYHAGEAIRGFMVDEYLSGQRLRRVTGRLATGFHTINVDDDTAIVGTQVIYARRHEEGFDGVVGPYMRSYRRGMPKTIQVRAHVQHTRPKHYARDAARFGAPTAVRAAQRQMDLAIGEAGLGS